MIIYFAAAANAARKALERVCPKCQHKQLAPLSHRGQPVTCEACGDNIPANETKPSL